MAAARSRHATAQAQQYICGARANATQASILLFASTKPIQGLFVSALASILSERSKLIPPNCSRFTRVVRPPDTE